MEILKDDEENRVVLLTRMFDCDVMREMTATLYEHQAIFSYLVSDDTNQRFRLSATQADAFVEAWTTYKADLQAQAEAKEAEWDAKVETTRKRAEAVGVLLTGCESEKWAYFTLTWPAGSPLERFNRHWTSGNAGLSLREVHGRLELVEKHVQEAQDESVSDRVEISTFERLRERAQIVGGFFSYDYDNQCSLSFATPHPFATFWQKCDELTTGQVEYRLRYVEGVLKQSTKKEEVTSA